MARTNGVISASATHLWVPLMLGYTYSMGVQPRLVGLLSIDSKTGALRSWTTFRDSSESGVSIDGRGNLYASSSGLASTVFYYGVNQTLPPILQAPGPPVGGFAPLGPASFSTLAIDAIGWVRTLNASAIATLPAANVAEALVATRRAQTQLAATLQTVLEDAPTAGEISPETAQAAAASIQTARSLILTARHILGLAAPTALQQALAEALIVQSEGNLVSALALLPK